MWWLLQKALFVITDKLQLEVHLQTRVQVHGTIFTIAATGGSPESVWPLYASLLSSHCLTQVLESLDKHRPAVKEPCMSSLASFSMLYSASCPHNNP